MLYKCAILFEFHYRLIIIIMIKSKKRKSTRTIVHRPLPRVVMSNTYRANDGDHTRLVFESSLEEEMSDEENDDKLQGSDDKKSSLDKIALRDEKAPDDHIYEIAQ